MTADPERLNAAMCYLEHGWQPVPVPAKSKKPIVADWPNFRANGNTKDFFSGPGNIGVLLGESSRGLVDIDLDSPETTSIARHFLPVTSAVFGRISKPQSHYLYVVQPAPATTRFCDIDGSSLLELRSNRAQTIFPPSIHPSGEAVSWVDGFAPEPARVDSEQLLHAVHLLAAAALLVRHYPAEGCRHELTLAFSGALARAKWGNEQISHFLEVVTEAAGDEETRGRVRDGEYSVRRLDSGRPATGWPRVEKLVGKEVAQRLRIWLVLTESRGTTAEIATAECGQKKSQATRLVELAFGQGLELFHGADGTPYASMPVGEHRETWPTKSKAFRDFLAHLFYVADARTPNSQALRDAVQTFDGQARFEANEENVCVRIGEQGGNIYLDLGDADWQVVEISAEGWRLIENPPVHFRRPAGQGALPLPVHGGKIDELRPFLNLGDEEDFVLICAWLVAAFRARGPYPILYFVGEQGSAKSTATRVLRRLIDPYKAELRTAPRDERDLLIAANNSHIIALDNLSRLDPWLSDGMCRLATGGGLATRELYTDGDEVLFDAQRPQLMNGIEECAVRGDFLERAIIVTLLAILDAARRDEKTFWEEFASAQPRVLGALLDAVSAALKNLNSVQLTEMPRMADFYLWSLAAAPAMGFARENFAGAYRRNRAHTHELVLDASVIASFLFAVMEDHPGALTVTTGDLLKELNQRAKDSDQKKATSWPKSARALSAHLRRLAPTLRAHGILYTPPDRRTAARTLTLSRIATGPASSASSASALTGAAFMQADLHADADLEGNNGKDGQIDRHELSRTKQEADAVHAVHADLPPTSEQDDDFDLGAMQLVESRLREGHTVSPELATQYRRWTAWNAHRNGNHKEPACPNWRRS